MKLRKFKTRLKIVAFSAVLLATALIVGAQTPQLHITTDGNYLSISLNNVTTTAKAAEEPQLYQGPTMITPTSWGYEYNLENGDIVQVGDNTTTDFKAMVKTIRGLHQDSWFSLGWSGGTFTPSVDNLTVSFDFNADTYVSIYPVEPSERLPEGGIEYDVTLTKKPAKPTVTLDIDWQGITWVKVLPLDEEYDLARCQADWGDIYTDFILSPTEITGILISSGLREVVKSRPEYEVNSYLGVVNEATDVPTNYGINNNPESEFYGQQMLYHRISKSYLYIHRGQMTDALGSTTWITDINIDEQARTITFDLDRTWLQGATYPVSQVCGVDPAYSEVMVGSQLLSVISDGAWYANVYSNYHFGAPLTSSACVWEMMLENQQKGSENLIGVRATGSSFDRYVNLHEAEPTGGGSGDTHCRMFVQGIWTASNGDYFQVYSEDVSDTWFYILGYWENVSFTEVDGLLTKGGYAAGTDTWIDYDTLGGTPPTLVANKVYQVIYTGLGEEIAYFGVRSAGSSLDRKVLVNEAESGGYRHLDFLVMSDDNADFEVYDDKGGSYSAYYDISGYFSAELAFVDTWQLYSSSGGGADSWNDMDVSSDLDQDGRVTDWLCLNPLTGTDKLLGVRDGDDTSTARYLWEHEAEGDGVTGEKSGFSMSAISNASGVVHGYAETGQTDYYLVGYFKPAGGFNISNSPSSENLGVVADSSTYYAYGSAPSNPVTDGECTFTVTNNGDACDLDMKITDFTGGTTWNIVATSPGSNEVRVTAYYSGQNPASGLVLANTDAEFYDALASSSTIKWDFKFESGTLTDEPNVHSATITITAVAED